MRSAAKKKLAYDSQDSNEAANLSLNKSEGRMEPASNNTEHAEGALAEGANKGEEVSRSPLSVRQRQEGSSELTSPKVTPRRLQRQPAVSASQSLEKATGTSSVSEDSASNESEHSSPVQKQDSASDVEIQPMDHLGNLFQSVGLEDVQPSVGFVIKADDEQQELPIQGIRIDDPSKDSSTMAVVLALKKDQAQKLEVAVSSEDGELKVRVTKRDVPVIPVSHTDVKISLFTARDTKKKERFNKLKKALEEVNTALPHLSKPLCDADRKIHNDQWIAVLMDLKQEIEDHKSVITRSLGKKQKEYVPAIQKELDLLAGILEGDAFYSKTGPEKKEFMQLIVVTFKVVNFDLSYKQFKVNVDLEEQTVSSWLKKFTDRHQGAT